jgi:hypothetical protein
MLVPDMSPMKSITVRPVAKKVVDPGPYATKRLSRMAALHSAICPVGARSVASRIGTVPEHERGCA